MIFVLFRIIDVEILFVHQSLKLFTFRVKFSDSIFLFLGLSPIVKLIGHEKSIFLSFLRGKYYLIHLEIVRIPKTCFYNIEILLKTR